VNAVPHGAVLEAFKEDGGRGNVIRVILTRGQLQRGHHFTAGEFSGRIKDMRGLEHAPPVGVINSERIPGSLQIGNAGIPLEIMGSQGLPGSGSEFSVCSRDMSMERAHVANLAFDYPRQARFQPGGEVVKIHPAMSGHLSEERRARMAAHATATSNAMEIRDDNDEDDDGEWSDYSDDDAAEQAFLQQSITGARRVDSDVIVAAKGGKHTIASVPVTGGVRVEVATVASKTKKDTKTPPTTTTTTPSASSPHGISAPATPFPESLVAPKPDLVAAAGRKVRAVVIKANTSGSLQMLLDSIARHNEYVRSGTPPPVEADPAIETAKTPEKKKKTSTKKSKKGVTDETTPTTTSTTTTTTTTKQKHAPSNEGRTRVEIDIIRANVGKVTPSDIQMAAGKSVFVVPSLLTTHLHNNNILCCLCLLNQFKGAAADLPAETDDDATPEAGFTPSTKHTNKQTGARGIVMSFRSAKPIGKVLATAKPLRVSVRHYKVFHELLDDLYADKPPRGSI
jgi:hypothetical protein